MIISHLEFVQYKMYDMLGGHRTYMQYGDLTAECNKLKETTFSVLEPNLNLRHHIYHNNYYNTLQYQKLSSPEISWSVVQLAIIG